MSNNYHTRIFVLAYSDLALEKLRNTNIDAFHQALGRQVAYNLFRDRDEDMVEYVSASLHDNEVVACHHPMLKALPEVYGDGVKRYIGSNQEQVNCFDQALRAKTQDLGRPFVLGAILHSDGQWGFHS